MRAAEAHRHAEALHGADGDVGAERCRGLGDGESQRIGDEDHQRAHLMRLLDRGRVVAIDAARVRPRDNERRRLLVGVAVFYHDPNRFGACLHDVQHLRVQLPGQRNAVARVAVVAVGDRNRLRHGRRFVEQRGRGHRQAGEFGNKRLEMEQHLQPALADLGLVGRVGGVPGGILEQVALDHGRHVAAMIAGADEALGDLVLRHHRGQFGERIGLAQRRRQVERPVEPDRAGHRLRNQRVDGGDAERGEHGAHVLGAGSDMPVCECGGFHCRSYPIMAL